MQYAKSRPLQVNIPTMTLEKSTEVTEEIISTSLRRALNRYSALQAPDGYWPGEYSGLMFIMPMIVSTLCKQFTVTMLLFFFQYTDNCIDLCPSIVVLVRSSHLNCHISSRADLLHHHISNSKKNVCKLNRKQK